MTPRKPEATTSSIPFSSSSTKVSKAADPVEKASKSSPLPPFLIQPTILDDPGIIQTALNDIDDALTNGTLQPLPPDLVNNQKEKKNVAGFTFDADTGRVWWHKLKEMTKFYFFGVVKLGREHRIQARDVRSRLKDAQEKGLHGPSEWRDKEFLTTYKMDLARLVPFVSIIVIIEEILPLIIIYAPFLLPSTCKLPSQARRIEDLADRKRWDSLASLGQLLKLREGLDGTGQVDGVGGVVLGHEQGLKEGRLDRLPEGSLPLLCRLLNIFPYGPSPYLKFRLRSTLAALSEEDTYFASSKSTTVSSASDPISQLSLGELRTVLGKRGFSTTPLSLPQLRQNLQWWLSYPEHPTEKRLAAVLELARCRNAPMH